MNEVKMDSPMVAQTLCLSCSLLGALRVQWKSVGYITDTNGAEEGTMYFRLSGSKNDKG